MSMRQLKISKSITNREAQSLEKYLQEISKLEMISPEEEVQLANRIKNGDKKALDRLTKANLRFVVSVAKQFQGQGLSLPDLINEGNLGLIKAAERFDDTRGFKFISFAVWWIRQNILYALAEHSRMVRLPMNKVSLSNRIARTHAMLEQKLERSPSAEELAEIMNMDLDEINHSLGQKDTHLSLDVPFSEDEEGTLLDVLENPGADETEGHLYHRESLKQEVARSMQTLPDRQKETLCYFFGIGIEHPMSLEDIAQKFDVTPERVRQIKEKAINSLRMNKNSTMLRSFLGA